MKPEENQKQENQEEKNSEYICPCCFFDKHSTVVNNRDYCFCCGYSPNCCSSSYSVLLDVRRWWLDDGCKFLHKDYEPEDYNPCGQIEHIQRDYVRRNCHELLNKIPETGLDETFEVLHQIFEFWTTPFSSTITVPPVEIVKAKIGPTHERPGFSIEEE